VIEHRCGTFADREIVDPEPSSSDVASDGGEIVGLRKSSIRFAFPTRWVCSSRRIICSVRDTRRSIKRNRTAARALCNWDRDNEIPFAGAGRSIRLPDHSQVTRLPERTVFVGQHADCTQAPAELILRRDRCPESKSSRNQSRRGALAVFTSRSIALVGGGEGAGGNRDRPAMAATVSDEFFSRRDQFCESRRTVARF